MNSNFDPLEGDQGLVVVDGIGQKKTNFPNLSVEIIEQAFS